MAFNVTYSFNNGAVTGTVTSITALRKAIYNYAHSGSVSSSTGSDYSHLTQCTLSGTAEGRLTTGNEKGTITGASHGLFYKCSALISVDLSNLDTSNVTNMVNMFYSCSALTKLDLSNFDTSNVINMNYMFYSCSALTKLDLSNFDTSNITDMRYMFSYCSSLTKLDLSSFDTSNVTGMLNMFDGCSSLTNLDLFNFDTSSVTEMSNMFQNCTTLTSIKVNKALWNISSVNSSNHMFAGCTSLPNFDSSCTHRTKAIDKSLGGYLDVISNVLVDLYTEYDNFPSKIFLSNNYIKVAREVGKYGI